MTNKELIALTAQHSSLTQRDVAVLLQTLSAVMTEQLEKGNSVHIRQFGAFEARERKERMVIHPKTGEKTLIPQKRQVVFRQTSNLKNDLK